MKVLFLTNTIDCKSGGWGRYSYDILDQFLKNNIDVFVLSYIKSEVSNINQEAILPRPLDFKKNYLLSFFYFLQIKNKIKKEKIDLIFCAVEPYSFIAFLLSKYLKVNYILVAHGTYSVLPFKNKIYSFFQKIAYKNAKNIICVSNYTKNKILEFIDLNNLVVINNGINLKKFLLHNPNNLKKENILLTVGDIKSRKGQLISARVFVKVKKEIPELKYYFVYSGKDELYLNKIKDFLRKNGVLNDVYFFENASEDKLKEIYKKSKIFIMLSQSQKFNFEGFGLVYLEANAYGLPTIGNVDSGAQDAIKDGYSGFLVKNEEEAVKKIKELILNKNIYLSFSKNAINFAKSMDWKNKIKHYLKLL